MSAFVRSPPWRLVIDGQEYPFPVAKDGWSDNDGIPSDRPKRHYLISPAAGQKPFAPVRGEGEKVPSRCLVSGPGPSSHVHVREYAPSNWWTTWGVLKKRREIERQGLPSFRNWRFITLTLDPEKYKDPLEGYLSGKDKMRRFLNSCRKESLMPHDAKWCWKLEFQQNGWPHWHLLVSRTQKYTEQQLKRIGELWALGRTNVERVQGDDFLYDFKYAFKPVIVHDEDDLTGFENQYTLPGWFLDYEGLREIKVDVKDTETGEVVETYIARKPITFAKVRFWQTSKGFYTGVERPKDLSRKEQQSWGIPLPVRTLADRAASTIQIVARDRMGIYKASAAIVLSFTAFQLWTLSGFHAVDSKAAFLGINNAVIPRHIVEKHATTPWKLQQLIQQNRLTLRRAQILQTRGQTLRTC